MTITRHRNSTFLLAILVASLVLASLAQPLSAAPIAPDSLGGLQAWYRVDNGVGTTGSAVTDWLDSGTNSYDMQQLTSARQPSLVSGQVGGYDSVDFDGSADYMAAGDHELHSNATGLTVIAVAKSDTAAGGVIVSKFNYSLPQRQWRLYPHAFDVQETNSSWNASSFASMSVKPEPGAFHTISGVWAPGSAGELYVEGRLGAVAAQAVNTITDTAAELMLGANCAGTVNRLDGMISEVVVYNRALSSAERLGVEQYLQQKYKLASNATPIAVDINFQAADPGDGGLPPGYLLDLGQSFGQREGGRIYGWDRDGTAQARDRDSAASPDERFDTNVHFKNGAYGPATWEMSLPEGTYWVRTVTGDPAFGGSTHNVTLENLSFTDPDPALAAPDWDEFFAEVTVTDGRLTVGSTEGFLDFIQVREVATPGIAINFQTGSSTAGLPDNYIVDSGYAFGDRGGLNYGWVDPDTGDPLSNTGNARNRNSGLSPDERYDTLNHLYNGGSQHYDWEIELRNGVYSVLAVFGESNGGTATNDIWVEGIRFFDVDPAVGNDWDLFMRDIRVTDGRLTISDGGLKGKICFLEITAVPEPSTMLLIVLGGMLAMFGRRRRAPPH